MGEKTVPFLPTNSPENLRVAVNGGEAQPATAVFIQTRFASLDVSARQVPGGATETWSRFRTRPAFEVAMVRQTDQQYFITLMKKQRDMGGPWRVKIPGGYLWDTFKNFAPGKVEADTGLRFDPDQVVQLPGVIGHSEIVTPIALYYTFNWQRIGIPRAGIEVFEVSLVEAVRMACDNEVENDSSFHLIMKLSRQLSGA